MSEIDPIQFGALSQRVETLAENVEKLDKAVERLTTVISESRGGWKMLASLGTLVAAVSGAVTWLIGHVKFTP